MVTWELNEAILEAVERILAELDIDARSSSQDRTADHSGSIRAGCSAPRRTGSEPDPSNGRDTPCLSHARTIDRPG